MFGMVAMHNWEQYKQTRQFFTFFLQYLKLELMVTNSRVKWRYLVFMSKPSRLNRKTETHSTIDASRKNIHTKS